MYVFSENFCAPKIKFLYFFGILHITSMNTNKTATKKCMRKARESKTKRRSVAQWRKKAEE